MFQSNLPRLLLLCVFLLSPVPAHALPQLTLSSPNADGVFILTAASFDGVHGVDTQISYDSTTLSNPRIEMGNVAAGTVNAANRGNPIRIMIIAPKPLKGGGTVATITFDRSGSSPGSITNFRAALSDLYGRTVPVQSLLVPAQAQPIAAGSNGGAEEVTTSKTASTAANSKETPAAGGGRYVVGGTLKMSQNDEEDYPGKNEGSPYKQPENAEQQKGEPEPPLQPRPQPHPETAAPPAPDAPAAPAAPTPTAPAAPTPAAPAGGSETARKPAPEPVVQRQKIVSVLERFRLFRGEKTLPALVALFKRDTGDFPAGFRQYPEVGVSDGVSTVKVVIPKSAAGDKTPNFTFRSAKFVAVAPSGEGGWDVEVRPERGTVDAAVNVLTNNTQQDYPLTVTPKPEVLAHKTPEAMETEFPSFIKDQGSAVTGKDDLNGDGKRDYIDDYIYVANYLLKLEQRERQKSPPRPQQ